MTRSLDEWLAYQDRVNVRSIELGLDRVSAVWQRMGAPAPARRVITVGGTNGKGSTVAMLETMLAIAALHALEPGRDLHAAASAGLRSARVREAVAELRH